MAVTKVVFLSFYIATSLVCGMHMNYFHANEFPFRDHSLPVEERIEDLINRLTVEEVINQTVSYMLNATPGIPRLGILPYVWDTECMRGQMMSNGTAFPQNLGLAATFRCEKDLN